MPWTEREYSKGQINRAGVKLANANTSDGDYPEDAMTVLHNWRSCHAFPLNTIQNGIRKHVRGVYPSALVAQRLKRTPSVILKLRRIPGMQLSRMQDIGGCRAVVRNIGEVYRTAISYNDSNIRHELIRVDDYIDRPQLSGYRSLHLVYRYYSDKNSAYNGQAIEVQLRTITQHAWATAVEMIGQITHSSLKSSIGPAKWKRFFKYMGSIFAELEGAPKVPYAPRNRDVLYRRTILLAQELQVRERLETYHRAFRIIGDSKTEYAYYLMILSQSSESLTIIGYMGRHIAEAQERYASLEKEYRASHDIDVVLVAATALRRAYPNYFMNTNVFIEKMDDAFADWSSNAVRRMAKRFISK